MKLIPARCPSCGSNIEVDKDKSTTKCEYCETKIIIEDAIEKYKIELSGNVKIDNLPTALNYLKLGTRNIDKGEYKKANEQLEKAIELDPDNPSIITKEALSKALMSELNKNGFDKIIYSIQETKKITYEDIDEDILYCVDILERKRKEISNLISLKPNKTTFEKLTVNASTMANILFTLFPPS